MALLKSEDNVNKYPKRAWRKHTHTYEKLVPSFASFPIGLCFNHDDVHLQVRLVAVPKRVIHDAIQVATLVVVGNRSN